MSDVKPLTAGEEASLRTDAFDDARGPAWFKFDSVTGLFATLDAARARIAALEEGLGLLVQDYESLWFSESGEATACRERLAPYRALLTPADPVEAPSDCHPQEV